MITSIVLCILLLIQVGIASNFNPRIINGDSTFPTQYPFMAQILSGLPPIRAFQHACAGVILDAFWILSSASCLSKLRGFRKSTVKVGKYFTAVDSDSTQTLHINRKIIHEDYDSETHRNDIGLILLATPLNFTRRVRRVRTPRYDSVDGQRVEMVGWGLTSSGICGRSSETLRRAAVDIIDNKFCNSLLANEKGNFQVKTSHLCTMSNGSAVASYGDSGGPIIQYIQKTAVVVGIMTNQIRYSASLNLPTISTRVRDFVNWISTKMSQIHHSLEV